MANERSAPRRVDASGGSKKQFGKQSNKQFDNKSRKFDKRGGPKKDYEEEYRADKRHEGSRPDRPRPLRRRGPRPDPNQPRPNAPKKFGAPPADGKIRLNKFLAEAGVASRRAADEIIADGQITINGKKVFELGIKVNPREDRILYNGKPLTQQTQFIYYAFNKPKSVVTSTYDPQGRPTILDFFPKSRFRLFPVGRLDWDSEGLLLVTNDGEFSNRVIHPDAHVPKTYHVKLSGIPTDIQLDKLKKGVSTISGKVAALHVRRLPKATDKKSWIEISIGEGKNHQIKNMFAKLGFDVEKLRRVAIGEYRLGNLLPGKFRELDHADLDKIFKKRKPKDAAKNLASGETASQDDIVVEEDVFGDGE